MICISSHSDNTHRINTHTRFFLFVSAVGHEKIKSSNTLLEILTDSIALAHSLTFDYITVKSGCHNRRFSKVNIYISISYFHVTC